MGRRVRGWMWLPALAAILLPLMGAGAPVPKPGAPKLQVVVIRGMAFVPASLTIQVGDTVQWDNEDIVPHTVTSAGEPHWTTGVLERGQQGVFVARQKGRLAYYCEFHPTMKGIVTIK